jgi:mRNA-degrading endonuclease RelE of RelBE toxin-antitoxin system
VQKRYKVVISPLLAEQLEALGLVEQAKSAIRDAMSNPERAGKPLTGSLFPYRRLKISRYRLIYKIDLETDPVEVQFLFCAMRKEGTKQDVYRQLTRALRRGEIE